MASSSPLHVPHTILPPSCCRTEERKMDMFKVQLIYHHGPLSRAFVLRVLLLSAAVAILPFINRDDTRLHPDSSEAGCRRRHHGSAHRPFSLEALDSVVLVLLEGGHLSLGGRSLCLGPGGAVASAAMRRLGFPPDQLVVSASEDACGSEYLPFGDASFDFVLSAGGLDGARAPARVAMEIERVLAPGSAGAVLAWVPRERPQSLVRTAAPVAAMLRASDVVAVRTVNSSLVLVVFRKKRAPATARSLLTKRGHFGQREEEGLCLSATTTPHDLAVR